MTIETFISPTVDDSTQFTGANIPVSDRESEINKNRSISLVICDLAEDWNLTRDHFRLQRLDSTDRLLNTEETILPSKGFTG